MGSEAKPSKDTSAKDTSAGIVLYRSSDRGVEVLLVHPGGPFWKNKDDHGWSVPKGIVEPGEDIEDAAAREFTEEVGAPPPVGKLIALPVLDIGKKYLELFALEGDLNVTSFGTSEMCSNTFEMEWPPKSGKTAEFPEVDKVQWFGLDVAESKLHKSQVAIVSLVRTAICV